MVNKKDWKLYDRKELTNDQYHAQKQHWSSSNLKDLLDDPSVAYKKKILGEKEEIPDSRQKVYDDGTLAHTMILEEDMLDEEFAFYPGFRCAGKDFQIFKQSVPDNKIIFSKSRRKKVESWVDAYRANETAVNLIKGCDPELSLFGELNGVPIKVRGDAVNIEEGYIVDVKTSGYDIDVQGFKDTVAGLKYQLSASLYCQLFEEYYGKPFEFYWLVLGKRCKTCELYKMSSDTRREGDGMVRKALNVYKKCMETDVWEKPEIKLARDVDYSDYEILEI